MSKIEEIKKILIERKEEIREKYGVIILGVFGSYARGEEKETSDIDILVEIEKPIGLKFFELWDWLEKLLNCKVDLVRAKLLREEIKDDIIKQVVYI
uniref:Nucleotidyltransferase n=1 Tax=Hydrogenobacter sp. TaxID=2152829 RepID=A0A7C2Z2I3_9AQUI